MKAAPAGNWLNGIKIPPIKRSGNLTRFIKTIISEVWSVRLADNKRPKRDPRIPIKIIPKNMKNKDNGVVINTMGNKTMKDIAIIEVIMIE